MERFEIIPVSSDEVRRVQENVQAAFDTMHNVLQSLIRSVPVGTVQTLAGGKAPADFLTRMGAGTEEEFLRFDGAMLVRTEYPALWAWAQANARVVTEAVWAGGDKAAFSTGDTSTTFRLPQDDLLLQLRIKA